MSQILGALFAILIGIISIPTYISYQNQSNENLRISATAKQAIIFNTASNAYVQQNSVAIQAAATATVPAIISVAMMKATNNLDASFSTNNPYGQTWQLEVLEPVAGNLQALALTTGGQALTDKVATRISTVVGSAGGFLPLNDSGIYPGASANAYGAFGGFTVPTANYTGITGGEIASLLTFNNGQLVDNRLYRNAVPGQPQLNTMNTPLIMASTQALNGACATMGAIAQDGTGAVLSCQAGTWQAQGSAFWKDPVGTFATLPVCNAVSIWQTRIAKRPAIGAEPRAYTCNGAVWQALAVNDAGNLVVAGTTTTATLGVTGNATVGGNEAVAGTVTAGNVTTAGQVTTGTAQFNTVAVENTACASNGLVARDAVGLLLSCQSSVWKKASGNGIAFNGVNFSDMNSDSCITSGIGCSITANCRAGTFRVSATCLGGNVFAATATSYSCRGPSGGTSTTIANIYCM